MIDHYHLSQNLRQILRPAGFFIQTTKSEFKVLIMNSSLKIAIFPRYLIIFYLGLLSKLML